MSRQRRIKQQRAVGAAVTRNGIGSVDVLDREPGHAERTKTARDRASGAPAACASCSGQQPRADAWFTIVNFADQPNRAAIYIFEEIGYWGIDAYGFVRQISDLNVEFLDVYINSPGGEVDDGVAIFNALRGHRAFVTTYVVGLAASAASFIALAGDKVCISEFGQLMIHDAMGFQFGNAGEMRSFADLLDRYSDNIAGIYAQKSGGTTEQWRELMRAETWFTGGEAVEAGLCDEVHDAITVASETATDDDTDDEDEKGSAALAARLTARWDYSLYGYRYAGRDQAPAPVLTSRAEESESPTPTETEPAAESVETVTEAEPVEDAQPADSAVAVPTGFVSGDTQTEPSEVVEQEADADEQPAEPAAAEAVEPEPAAPATEPIADATDTDAWAQLISPLISATPASPTWADALANLTTKP
jgi:ATP-dependent protease ClpP protease subunit